MRQSQSKVGSQLENQDLKISERGFEDRVVQIEGATSKALAAAAWLSGGGYVLL